MRYRLTSSVRAPIDKVFAYSVDPRNTSGAHGPGATITKWTDGEIGLGTIFRYSAPLGGHFESEIVAFDPPHSFVTEARVRNGAPQRGWMSFEERDGLTYVTTEADFRFSEWVPGWLHPLAPLALAFMWPMLWVMTRIGERMARRALE